MENTDRGTPRDELAVAYGSSITFGYIASEITVDPFLDLSDRCDIDGWRLMWENAVPIMNWADAYRAWPWEDFPVGLQGAVGAVATIAAAVRAGLDGGADLSGSALESERAARILGHVDDLSVPQILGWARRLKLDTTRFEWLERELGSASAAGRLKLAVDWLVDTAYGAPRASASAQAAN